MLILSDEAEVLKSGFYQSRERQSGNALSDREFTGCHNVLIFSYYLRPTYLSDKQKNILHYLISTNLFVINP